MGFSIIILLISDIESSPSSSKEYSINSIGSVLSGFKQPAKNKRKNDNIENKIDFFIVNIFSFLGGYLSISKQNVLVQSKWNFVRI